MDLGKLPKPQSEYQMSREIFEPSTSSLRYTIPFGCWVTILNLPAASRQSCRKSDRTLQIRTGNDAPAYCNGDRNHSAALNYWIFFCPFASRPYPSTPYPTPITNRNKNPIKLIMDAAGGGRMRI